MLLFSSRILLFKRPPLQLLDGLSLQPGIEPSCREGFISSISLCSSDSIAYVPLAITFHWIAKRWFAQRGLDELEIVYSRKLP